MRDRVKEGQMWLLLIIVGWLVLSLCSCKQIEYVPYKVETKDSIYLNKYIRDSIYVTTEKETVVKNDTIYVTKTQYALPCTQKIGHVATDLCELWRGGDCYVYSFDSWISYNDS